MKEFKCKVCGSNGLKSVVKTDGTYNYYRCPVCGNVKPVKESLKKAPKKIADKFLKGDTVKISEELSEVLQNAKEVINESNPA